MSRQGFTNNIYLNKKVDDYFKLLLKLLDIPVNTSILLLILQVLRINYNILLFLIFF